MVHKQTPNFGEKCPDDVGLPKHELFSENPLKFPDNQLKNTLLNVSLNNPKEHKDP